MDQVSRVLRTVSGSVIAGVIGAAVFGGSIAAADPKSPMPIPGPEPHAAIPAALPSAAITGPVTAAAPLPRVTGTIRDYFTSAGVKLLPQKPQDFHALEITLPMPPRWSNVPDPNVPDAFAVIADRLGNSIYTSNAQVVVYKLVGSFDPREAIKHGPTDAQQLLNWQDTNASLADSSGFPSSLIEGTFRQDDMTLNTSRRYVIATSGHDNYLVSLAVTTAASQAVADAPATDAIVNGFRVAVPGQAGTHNPAPTAVQLSAPLTAAGQPAPAAGSVAPLSATIPAPAATPQFATLPQPAAIAPQSLATPQLSSLLALLPGLPPLPNLPLLGPQN